MTYLGDRAPAHSLLEKLREEVTAAPATAAPFSTGKPRIPAHAQSWHDGIVGELRVAALLDQLPTGWLVLHSVPLGDGHRDIDHVVISPGGRVLTINTKRHPGASIWAAHDALMVNGSRHPHVLRARDEGQKASARLSAALGRPVRAEPFIVFVDERSITMKEAPAGVTLASSRDVVRMLRRLDEGGDPLAADEVKRAATESATWTNRSFDSTSSSDLILWFMTLDRPAGAVPSKPSLRVATPQRAYRSAQRPRPYGHTPASSSSSGGYVSTNGLAVASLVLGIVSAALALIPFVGAILCWLPALLAIIFGCIGIGTANRIGGYRKTSAIWGIVCGLLPIPITLLGFFVFAGLIAGTTQH